MTYRLTVKFYINMSYISRGTTPSKHGDSTSCFGEQLLCVELKISENMVTSRVPQRSVHSIWWHLPPITKLRLMRVTHKHTHSHHAAPFNFIRALAPLKQWTLKYTHSWVVCHQEPCSCINCKNSHTCTLITRADKLTCNQNQGISSDSYQELGSHQVHKMCITLNNNMAYYVFFWLYPLKKERFSNSRRWNSMTVNLL